MEIPYACALMSGDSLCLCIMLKGQRFVLCIHLRGEICIVHAFKGQKLPRALHCQANLILLLHPLGKVTSIAIF